MKGGGHQPATQVDHDNPAELDLVGFIPALRSFFARQTHNVQQVDDLVQDVMLRMYARRDRKPLENPRGYIFQTASSVLRDQSRRDRVRQIMVTTDFSEFDIPDVECTPENVIHGRNQLKSVIAALNELPERTRDVFLLRRYEGLAYGEIAERTGLSISAIEKHVARAAAHLARRVVR